MLNPSTASSDARKIFWSSKCKNVPKAIRFALIAFGGKKIDVASLIININPYILTIQAKRDADWAVEP
jgi:hypothetical protein